METLRAPRWDRTADAWSPSRAEPGHQRATTPIYNALVKEWGAAGRAVPAVAPAAGTGRHQRTP
ncbi:hypothetical protein [Streptomyces fuscigenes]|uniref:hypothetical protein n=1 Tax=Streptomyces fuscigenes TaxID=1528880 RepID=UPI001F398D41|nr:hypothetical protein [Streptomyces fuscigenes]MCF3964282.1 hypothetical protein [Streptomyces fuscigenes]